MNGTRREVQHNVLQYDTRLSDYYTSKTVTVLEFEGVCEFLCGLSGLILSQSCFIMEK